LNAAGTTVLLTTHYLEEAQELCDRIAIINHGSLVVNESKHDLLRRIDNKKLTLTVDQDVEVLPENLKSLGWERLDERRISVAYKPSQAAVSALLHAVQVNGLSIVDLTTEEADLEDIFLQLTRKAA